MKISFETLAALLLVGIAWSAPTRAQGVPQGTYVQSCRDIRIQGDALVATCRTVDGRAQRAVLAAVSRCVGDIGNNNGTLQCNYGDGAQPNGQMPPQQGYAQPR
jgi:hypothetical protein